EVEAAASGIALTAGTSTKLVVDSARLVPLGADGLNDALFGNARSENDVCATTGHVGGDRDVTRLAGVFDDLGLALVELGVQDIVLDTCAIQHLGEQLRLLDRGRANEDRAALLTHLLD